MSAEKIDIEKLSRNIPEYPKEFFSKMQENVFCEISKLEEHTNIIKRKKRRKTVISLGIAASIALLVVGIVYPSVGIYNMENTKEFSEDFNFYYDFISNQENYTSSVLYMGEDYDAALGELNYQELEEEIEKYEIDAYLEYLYL